VEVRTISSGRPVWRSSWSNQTSTIRPRMARARIVSGAVALTAIPIWALTVTSFAGPRLALDTARGAWVAAYSWSLLAVLPW
jgi:hypothetical protein